MVMVMNCIELLLWRFFWMVSFLLVVVVNSGLFGRVIVIVFIGRREKFEGERGGGGS